MYVEKQLVVNIVSNFRVDSFKTGEMRDFQKTGVHFECIKVKKNLFLTSQKSSICKNRMCKTHKNVLGR